MIKNGSSGATWLCIAVIMWATLVSTVWRTDFDQAKANAKKEHKLILLRFSGSDWCVPCMKMDQKIFSSAAFSSYADHHLELVNADFPHQKRNKPAAAVAQQNEALAEKYNSDGHFPYTVLITPGGRLLKAWDGYDGEEPEAFVEQISKYAGSN